MAALPASSGATPPLDPAATDPRQIAANNSPAVARNPARPDELAVVNRVDSPAFTCALHLSTDGGASWAPGVLPFPAGEEQPPRCFAPDAAFVADGRLYVSFVTLKGAGNEPNALWLTTSTDAGRSFALPRRVWGPLTFGARLVTDPVDAETVSLVWLQVGDTATLGFATTANPVLLARSDDAGQNWAGPFRVTLPGRNRALAASVAAGPAGLYVAYLDLGDDVLDYSGAHAGRGGPPYPGSWSLVLARSGDGGATWSEVTVDDAIVPPSRIVVLFPPTPSLAVDRQSGRVYLSMADARAGDPDVWVWTAADGAAFGPPVRVNDTPAGDNTSQYLPALAVSPGGRLDVVYYDRRRDPQDAQNDVSFQSSTDGGRSFHRALRLTDRAFDSGIGFGAERGLPELGSRLALVSSRNRSLAIWPDTRAGTVASGKQDLTQALVELPSGQEPSRIVGASLAAIGAMVALGYAVSTGRARAHHRSKAPA